MKNWILTSLSVIALVLSIGACGNKKEAKQSPKVAPHAGPGPRAKHVRNLEVYSELTKFIETQGIKGGLCAQLVVPNTGDLKGIQVLEVSQGPCPANNELVDPAKTYVESNEIQNVRDGENYSRIFPANDFETAFGEVQYQHEEIAKKLPFRLLELCSQITGFDYTQVCYFAEPKDGKFNGTYYWE